MVASFPNDFMHSVCKGVTLKLLEELRTGDYRRLSSKLLNEMSEFLLMIRKDIPLDLADVREAFSILEHGKPQS